MAVAREKTVLERPQEEVHERHEEETGEDQDAADLTKGGTCRASACARVCASVAPTIARANAAVSTMRRRRNTWGYISG